MEEQVEKKGRERESTEKNERINDYRTVGADAVRPVAAVTPIDQLFPVDKL